MAELINGRTAEEIKRELRWAVFTCGSIDCKDCEYYESICSHTTDERLAPDALALIEHLESERDAALAKVPRWISVEDSLPWMNKKVLVSDGEIVTEAYYNGRGEWIHNGHDMEMGGVIVTHWTPLPEPPKEGE